MANPLSNENDLYEKIRKEGIAIHPLVWDTMYHYLGDYISVINGIATYYIEKNEPIALEDARKILNYTLKIKMTVDKILNPEKIHGDGQYLERIKGGDMKLHPVVKEFFTHYIGNDTHVINLCVSFYLDPLDEQPVALDDARKILNYTLSMRRFLDRLREETNFNKGLEGSR